MLKSLIQKGKNESIQQVEYPAHRRPFDVRASESGGKTGKKKKGPVSNQVTRLQTKRHH